MWCEENHENIIRRFLWVPIEMKHCLISLSLTCQIVIVFFAVFFSPAKEGESSTFHLKKLTYTKSKQKSSHRYLEENLLKYVIGTYMYLSYTYIIILGN